MAERYFTLSKFRTSIFFVLVMLGLYLISRINYLLFHSLADGVSIVIAACVFTIVWNGRRIVDNDYLIYVGIALLFFAFWDFLHLLGNKNMGVFPEYGNLGPALYIVSRYLLSISLLLAPLFINRKLNTTFMYAAYSLVTSFILLTIFYWHIFPVCIVENVGLTPFKVVSDYIICLILLGAIGLLFINRRSFDSRVLWLIVFSIILSIATGLAFTLYKDPFGIMNMAGHMFQIVSFYLIYLALIETSLTKPQEILYLNLKQNQESLAKSEERFRKTFYSSLDAVNINRLADGLYISINPGFTKIMGYTEEDIIGKSSIEYNIWENIKDRERLLAGLKKDGEVHNLEAPFRTKAGNIRYGLMSASVIDLNSVPHIISITRDINDRRQAETKLRETNAYLENLINYANAPIIVWDPQFRITRFNHAFEYLTGRSEADVLGKSLELLFPAALIEDSMALIRMTMTGERWETVEIKILHRDESVRTVLWNSATLFSADGQTPIATIAQGQDITLRKQAEAEKEKLEAQNRQLQKSESLGRMAAAIAHHFNNQLGVVIGNLEMAIDEQPKGAPPSRSLTSAMQAAWKSADMSGLMLTYLGQTHDKVEPLDISYTCRKILPILKAAMPENVILKTDFSSPGPITNTNHDYMQQILTNLITNAWEAIGNSTGSISLSVKTVSLIDIPIKNRFPVDWQSPDNAYACLEVIDTGCGIAASDIEQLFDPFSSTKFTGRGMGLAVVLGIVKTHKGVIAVESKLGIGSTFRIFFPLSEEALLQPQTAEINRDITISSPSPRKMEEGGTVLVVEDEEMLRDMAAAMLESFGFTVLKSKDGIDALDVFGLHQSEIKFVLTDLTMPRMNGWETLTALRKLQPDIPVILTSGYDLAHVMEGDHPELPQAFLAKPYNLKALRAAISQALESRKK